ncbi:site-specific integrase [Gramella jeungdoensis]|uniref:Site-specific integrase n=1 Tax=Gramella jeungdoensis TaxID=708091 RepID=A0ABT0YZJ3_9FLAO|nr:tyrosine-type recombinase/integrase [Gramella jeungdoensis]MCM8568879.1 site-specific integrase [Gramella jeungdoensis]
MATVKYRIRGKSKQNTSIYIYLSTGRGNFVEVASGFTVNSKDWSKTTNKPKQNSEENRKTFSDLNKLEKFIYDEVNDANSKGVLIDAYWLRQKINECFKRVKKTDNTLLTNHIQFIIDNANTRKIKGSDKIGLSERRVLGYKSFLKVIQDYEKVIKKKIHFLDINKPFVNKFTNWLLNTRNYATNYAGKIVDNLKTVALDAKSMDIDCNPYVNKIESFRERNQDRYIVTLSFEELEKIRKADLENEALINARKWLLIGCEIGQRASDLLRLTKEDIRYSKGSYYIDIEQKKTGKNVTIGVIAPHVIEIIENGFPYPVSSQKLNKHIKKVCEKAEITEKIEGKKYDKESGRKKLKKYRKCDLITSHCFRRSFATNYYKKIPTPILINITGHSKESLFLEYINRREDKDENANLFMKFYEEIHKTKKPELKLIKNASNEN